MDEASAISTEGYSPSGRQESNDAASFMEDRLSLALNGDDEGSSSSCSKCDEKDEADMSACITEQLESLPEDRRDSDSFDLMKGAEATEATEFDDSEAVFHDSSAAFSLAKVDENAALTHDIEGDNLDEERKIKLALEFSSLNASLGSLSTSCPSAPELTRGDVLSRPGAVAVRRGTWEANGSEELSLEYSAELGVGRKSITHSSVAEFGTVAELAPDHAEEVEALVQQRLNERLNTTEGGSSSQFLQNNSAEIVYGEPTTIEKLVEESHARRLYLKKRTVYKLLVGVLIVAGVIGIFLGIFLSRSSEDEPSASTPLTPTISPPASSPIAVDLSPTAAPTTSSLTERLSDAIGKITQDFQREAQQQALGWMQRNDTYTATNFDTLSNAELVERYAATVFLFSMSDDAISKTSLQYLIPDVPTCQWKIPNNNGIDFGFVCEKESVTELRFENQGFVGTLPDELVLLRNLQWIALWQNSVSGSIPGWIGDLSSLENLRIGRNQITGSIPDSLISLTNLITLQLTGNALTGTIPQAIGDLSNLEELSLENNDFTGGVPDTIGALTKLTAVRFFNNYNLGGSIPSGIWSLSRLLRIDAFSCQFTGIIPTVIGSLTKVRDVGLFNNSMSGTLPTEVGLMTSLVWFRVNDNPMNGTIPTELGRLDRLERFTIENTNIGGSLPSEMGMLTAMRYFDGSNGSLTGEVPSSFSALTDLRFFLLHGTNQSGSLEGVYCSDFSDREFVTLATSYCEGGENEQPASIECSCCNACCDAEKCYKYDA